MQTEPYDWSRTIERIYREESRRVLATLIRLLNDFELAEDALQDSFAAAVEKWPTVGLPANPRAWLVSTGRFKAIDKLRRQSRFNAATDELVRMYETVSDADVELDAPDMKDDRLRLIFTCCHPAIPFDAQVALTLREVCGLTTEEIARAYLTSPPTLAQRIVRAKRKIRDAGIPYEVPVRKELPERLNSVLRVVYLVFNEGYSASGGSSVTRPDLSDEAIHLGRLLVELLPDPETYGLLALMLLNESRREARTSDDGNLILLEDQDRSRWNHAMIDEGLDGVERALSYGEVGAYTIQAAISAVHARANDVLETDWLRIIGLYDLLLQASPSPVVELNRAVAVAMHNGPAAGLSIIDDIIARGELTEYHLTHAARADLYRRLGRIDEARASYHRARKLATQKPEQRFIDRRIAEMDGTMDH